MSGSIASQTLYPPQSIFTEVQAIHDTGIYYKDPNDEQNNYDIVSYKDCMGGAGY